MARSNRSATVRESVIQRQVCDVLDLYGAGLLVYERSNAGAAYTRSGRRIQLGIPGTSDIKIYRRGGKTTHLEIKSATGKQRPSQRAYASAITALGHEYIIVRTPEQVELLLAQWRDEDA